MIGRWAFRSWYWRDWFNQRRDSFGLFIARRLPCFVRRWVYVDIVADYSIKTNCVVPEVTAMDVMKEI